MIEMHSPHVSRSIRTFFALRGVLKGNLDRSVACGDLAGVLENRQGLIRWQMALNEALVLQQSQIDNALMETVGLLLSDTKDPAPERGRQNE